MRSESINGVLIDYPDAVSFCFGTMPVNVKGYGRTRVAMTLKNNNTYQSVSESRNLFQGKCFFDLSYYARTLFLTDAFGDINYYERDNLLTMVEFSVTLELFNGETSEGTLTFDTSVVWGALGKGEVFDAQTEFKWYRNLPFTFSVYYPYENQKSINILADGENVLNWATNKRSIWSFPVSDVGNASKVQFVVDGKTITYNADDCTEGVYLRWLDRQGFIRYWLFKRGLLSHEVKDLMDIKRSNMGEEMSRRIFKSAGATLKVCAPLVNHVTYDMLVQIAMSPMVDMYIGNNEWMGVNVKSETYTKENVTMQDFEATVILPDTKVQSV